MQIQSFSFSLVEVWPLMFTHYYSLQCTISFGHRNGNQSELNPTVPLALRQCLDDLSPAFGLKTFCEANELS